ncbi:uncharacterized protein LOC124321312 [Daphnia pulicaria]|uniref:uncharacterized protein LOC124321312 n=1 Tax=Daphnia pulicaria TaxID=35523 RepID=UPI001EECDD51|nr:uncharacterized protein LOC124321312 [Daphnia pulicaria]
MKFDEDFQLVVDVHSSEIFLDLDRNVLVKLKQTEAIDADSIIFETAVDEEVKAGSLKRKNDELSSSDCSSETTNESQEGSRESTDFLYSSSDSLNAQDLYNKKPRCMEKISSKASRVDGTSQILDSSDNGEPVPNAVVNQQVDLSSCTLTEEGYEEWEINPSLAALIKQNKLTLNVNQFFLVCARHLMRTFPLGRSKGLYRQYAEMIVRKYDCLKDRNSLIPYETVKAKFLACIRNESHYGTSKASRISKRLLQVQTTSEEGSTSTTDEVAAGTSSECVGPAATTTGEKDRDLKRRRSIVNGNANQTTVEILQNIPFCKNFPNVYADFMMMEPMSTITEEIFKQNFELLVQNLRRYLFQHTGKKYGEEENGTMEVLLAINALCSAKQGAKSSTPVFKYAKRGESSTIDYSGVNTSATVFFKLMKIPLSIQF